MHFLNLRMQSILFFRILICATITVTVVNAGSRKVLNSTFPTKSGNTFGIIQEARGSNYRVGQKFYDDDDISKEEKAVAVGSGDAKKSESKTTNPSQGESATARSCTGGAVANPITTPDLSALTNLAGGASGIIEIVVAVVVIHAIIWIKIIAAAVIIYWWIGAKSDKFGDSSSGGYGYGPSKPVYGAPQPVYGTPQPQYGTPSGYSSRGFGSSFNLEALGTYVWKAIDFFSEMNEGTSDSSVSVSKKDTE